MTKIFVLVNSNNNFLN